MKMIRPPEEINYSVNGEKVCRATELKIGRMELDTVVQDAPGSPMRATRRRTNIHILPKREDSSGWIYEMGIPHPGDRVQLQRGRDAESADATEPGHGI